MVRDRHGVARARRNQDVGALAFGHLEPARDAAAEDDRIGIAVGLRTDDVEVGACVVVRLVGRHAGHRLGIAQVKE